MRLHILHRKTHFCKSPTHNIRISAILNFAIPRKAQKYFDNRAKYTRAVVFESIGNISHIFKIERGFHPLTTILRLYNCIIKLSYTNKAQHCQMSSMMAARKQAHISEAMEDYLEAIYHISAEEGGGVKPGLISSRLGVHKSTVTIALRHLDALKLICYTPYQEVHLTVEGFKHAESVIKRHDVFYRFLKEVLEVDDELAEKTACKLEHALPAEIVDRFIDYVRNQIALKQLEKDTKDTTEKNKHD
jgi:DtxR family Mn-dependent transcriptional regulator